MSRFYGDLQGNRGQATRQGSKTSGIKGHLRGWNLGVKIYCFIDEATGKDRIKVYKTKGSRNPSTTELIADYTEKIDYKYKLLTT